MEPPVLNLFQDPKAIELLDSLDYDFTVMEKKSKSIGYRFGALEVAMRETEDMDKGCRDNKHF